MKFCTTEEFGTLSPTLLSELAAGEEVVVTKNGSPVALMIGVEAGRFEETLGRFEETLRAVRRAKAVRSFQTLRQQAARQGFFSSTEIDEEINAVRSARA